MAPYFVIGGLAICVVIALLAWLFWELVAIALDDAAVD